MRMCPTATRVSTAFASTPLLVQCSPVPPASASTPGRHWSPIVTATTPRESAVPKLSAPQRVSHWGRAPTGKVSTHLEITSPLRETHAITASAMNDGIRHSHRWTRFARGYSVNSTLDDPRTKAACRCTVTRPAVHCTFTVVRGIH